MSSGVFVKFGVWAAAICIISRIWFVLANLSPQPVSTKVKSEAVHGKSLKPETPARYEAYNDNYAALVKTLQQIVLSPHTVSLTPNLNSILS